VVTEKATNTIDVFPVGDDGRAGAPVSNPSNGVTPFGFAFGRRGTLIVSNAAGGAKDASSLSSYRVGDDGVLQALDGPVATTETAACWVVTAGRFAFTTNAGSGTVSGMRVDRDGGLSLLAPDGVSAATGTGPTDVAVGGSDLFTLNGGAHTITAHGIDGQGGLHLEGATTVPVGVVGLAVR
jgi:6-phosphogluconolactonase